jgi:hypothetical protein
MSIDERAGIRVRSVRNGIAVQRDRQVMDLNQGWGTQLSTNSTNHPDDPNFWPNWA